MNPLQRRIITSKAINYLHKMFCRLFVHPLIQNEQVHGEEGSIRKMSSSVVTGPSESRPQRVRSWPLQVDNVVFFLLLWSPWTLCLLPLHIPVIISVPIDSFSSTFMSCIYIHDFYISIWNLGSISERKASSGFLRYQAHKRYIDVHKCMIFIFLSLF